MKLDLQGKKAIVAGGSRGIGRSIALAFAEAGADVSICARGEESLRATEAELKRFNHQVHAATCDLGDGPAVTAYVKSAAEALGGIDILVNNASGFGASDDEAGWAASINVDLMASVRASYAALPHLEKSKGSIIHISSIAGLAPSARTPPYGAVKAALIQYTLTQRNSRQAHPRELHRAGLDRVSRRHLGKEEDRRAQVVQRRPRQHPFRPPGHAGGNRQRRAVPRERRGKLGHRPDHRGRRRADAQLNTAIFFTSPALRLILLSIYCHPRLRFESKNRDADALLRFAP